MEKTSADDETATLGKIKAAEAAEDNARTIRPSQSPQVKPPALPLSRDMSAVIDSVDEDYSDLAGFEEGVLEEKVTEFKVRACGSTSSAAKV
jgi:hypothetical protein